MNAGKFIGCVMMTVGCTVGGGMLALPMVAYSAGFTLSVLLLIAMFGLMLYSGLLTLEVNLTLPAMNSSHSSMAAKVFGKFGQAAVWLNYILLLLTMLVAYIAGESDIIVHYLQQHFQLEVSHTASALLFTVGLGFLVFWSTNATDYCNRILATFKGLFLAAFLLLATPFINMQNLLAISSSEALLAHAKYLTLAIAAFMCAFCYHFVIPGLRLMAGDDPKTLKKILVVSNLISLAIYIWWMSVAFGIVPLGGEHGYIELVHCHGASVGQLVQNIVHTVNNSWFAASMNAFTNVTLTTAFLGGSLSMFIFLADGFKIPDTRMGRLVSILLTLVPPLVIALFFPDSFVLAMSWSGVFTALICITFPALMVYKLRQQQARDRNSGAGQSAAIGYRVKSSKIMLIAIVIVSTLLIAVIVASLFGCLPFESITTAA